MTFRCPIDGNELEDGAPCPDHGIAFSTESMNRQASAAVTVASPVRTSSTPAPRKASRKGKAR